MPASWGAVSADSRGPFKEPSHQGPHRKDAGHGGPERGAPMGSEPVTWVVYGLMLAVVLYRASK
jgi:hypothetical protein